jgi:hypothetical protein
MVKVIDLCPVRTKFSVTGSAKDCEAISPNHYSADSTAVSLRRRICVVQLSAEENDNNHEK